MMTAILVMLAISYECVGGWRVWAGGEPLMCVHYK